MSLGTPILSLEYNRHNFTYEKLKSDEEKSRQTKLEKPKAKLSIRKSKNNQKIDMKKEWVKAISHNFTYKNK
jgi:hypothetical protein